MSETINISNFDFYLDFKNDDYGLKQIDEPIGIDEINLITESDDDRYARDIFFGGGDKIKLTFTSEKGSKDLGYELDKLIEYDNIYGFESEVDFIIINKIDETRYVLGQVEYEVKDTDHYSYFSCNIIQVKNQALLKRLEDVKIDVFSNEDLDGNELAPVQTSNILIPAKPELQSSSFTDSKPSVGNVFVSIFNNAQLTTINATNNANNQLSFGIKNTVSFISLATPVSPVTGNLGSEGLVFLEAESDLTNVTFNISGVDAYVEQDILNWDVGIPLTRVLSGSGGMRLYIKVGADVDNITDTYLVWEDSYSYVDGDAENQTFSVPTDFSYEIDLISSGSRVYIYFEPYGEAVLSDPPYNASTLTRYGVLIYLNRMNIDIDVISNPLDTVTKCVRLIDVARRTAQGINQDFNIITPRLDAQGEHYNQFVFSGDMLRGRNNPFNFEWRDLSDYFLSEPNLDYQVIGDNIFIGKEDDFYPNVEIASFLEAPDSTFNIAFNPRFTINTGVFNFKSFNQDKDDNNTIDGVHTEMQLATANRQVQNNKDIECKFVRDPFLLATTQDKASTETNTSLTQDEKVFIGDAITIAPGSTRGFKRLLNHNVNSNGELRLLGNAFNWEILGISVGDIFTIDDTSNAGEYTVIEITNTIITLTPFTVGLLPTTINEEFTTVTYFLTDVDYILRTNEGFDTITGINNPNNYVNLRRTIKKSWLENYGAYLATATLYKPEDIKVTNLKNNVDLTTQFNGGAIINELAPITQAELPYPILSPRYITCKVRCTFEEYIDFKTKIETINDTDNYVKTIGGFVRIINNNGRVLKGFVKKSDFTWANGVMDLGLEEKWQSDITDITRNSGLYSIDETGYDLDGATIIDYNVTNTNYIQFFDANTRPLTNVMKYNLVSVNGVVYDNINELTGAINNL